MREKLIKLITLVIGLALFAGAVVFANSTPLKSSIAFNELHFTPAVVTDIIEDNSFSDPHHPEERWGSIRYEARLRSGERRGEYLEVNFFFTQVGQEAFEVGDRIIILYSFLDGEVFSADIYNRDRSTVLTAIVVAFLAVLIALGGKVGFKTVISLIFTLTSIIFILNPLIMRGFPAIPTTFIILSVVTIIVLILISGFTKKTFAATVACILGVLAAASISQFAGWLSRINGFNTEEVGFLLHASYQNNIALDAAGLFVAGVLIASLGAVMDTAVSITSSAQELKLANPGLTQMQLFKSSFTIGRDVMGTMANTLILAFAGSSLNLMLTLHALQTPIHQLINNDFIAVEIIRSLAGSLGIALTVPAAAWISSWLYSQD